MDRALNRARSKGRELTISAVNRGVRKRIWDGLVDAEHHQRYYSQLAFRFRKRHQYLAVGVSILSICAVLSLRFIDFKIWWQLALPTAFSGTAALTAAILIAMDYSTKAAKAESASVHYQFLYLEWESLWWRQTDDDVSGRVELLSFRLVADPGASLDDDEDLSDQCFKEANDILLEEFKATKGFQVGL